MSSEVRRLAKATEEKSDRLFTEMVKNALKNSKVRNSRTEFLTV
ncbi:hypothetical protein [Nostoc sp.]